jgi:tRNA A-37 threonylcarbamoyl transferase component Bud32
MEPTDTADTHVFVKSNVSWKEYNLQCIVYNANIIKVPKPYSYDSTTKTMNMQKIPSMCVADTYGESIEGVPNDVLYKIRENVQALYTYGVEYIDITGYNFIEYQGHIWTIDFEHASFNQDRLNYDPFILSFLKGKNEWNKEFE